MRRAPVLLLGLGNPDRRDDGVGPAVLAVLAGRLPPDVEALSGARDVAALVEAMAGRTGLVAVDAALGGGLAPGALRLLDPDAAPLAAPRPDPSGHAFGLLEALGLSDALGERPARVRILAVGAADLSHGRGLAPPVAAVVGEAAAAALAAIEAVREGRPARAP